VEVVVTTVSTVHEELRGGFDVAIRRGVASKGSWPRYNAIPVLEDVDTLIMSPKLFAKHPIHTPADVEGHVLLATETRPGEWVDWLEAAGLSHLVGRPRRVFDHFFITRQAIDDGFGLGIGPLPLLDVDLTSGRIMTPLPEIRVRRTGYVALTALDAEKTGALPAFLAWLAAQQEQMRDLPNDLNPNRC